MTVQPWEPSGIIAECVNPEPQDIRHALDKKQVLWRWKNGTVQVLAQTLSNYLDTRTSSLLAVNKKHGVPSEFIHHEWKRTWVNLDGLKKRVAQTGHSSDLLKGLKLVIEAIDAVTTPDDSRVELSSVEQKKQAKPGTKRNPIDVCEVAVEAYERAVHNTERINKLTRDEKALENLIFSTRDAASSTHYQLEKRADMLADRIHRLEGGSSKSINEVHDLEVLVKNLEGDLNAKIDMVQKQNVYAGEAICDLRERVNHLDGQATQNTVNQTLLGDLNTRLGRIVTQADSLDSRTEGIESRVSVLEDTSQWLGWTLAGVIGLRFLSLMLRLLRRK